MNIGVFDSGRGGELVAEKLKVSLPNYNFIAVNDIKNLPYGNKTCAEIREFTKIAITPLLKQCPVIVIACNTATAHAIEDLRQAFTNNIFIGFEPMIKTAAELTRTDRITVLATEATLRSERYKKLVGYYGQNLLIDKPNTDMWATMIENGQYNQIDIEELKTSVNNGSDTIVLACTHYLALYEKLSKTFPKVNVIEPTEAIAKQIVRSVSEIQNR